MPSEGDRAWCYNLLIQLTKEFGEVGLCLVLFLFACYKMLLFKLLHIQVSLNFLSPLPGLVSGV